MEKLGRSSLRIGRVLLTLGAVGAGLALSCSPSGTTGSGGGTSTTSTVSTGAGTGCKADADCPGQVCDTATGKCGECTSTNDTCKSGQFCNASDKCQIGCKGNSDCTAPTVCDPTSHNCVGCDGDADCNGGSCCDKVCYDLTSDPQHCGACDKACDPVLHGTAACTASMCGFGACGADWADCNQDPSDGCEWNITANGPCACTVGDVKPCYTGPAGTENVGECHAGTQTCTDGVHWSQCMGEVIPSAETCNQKDDDCDGKIEPQPCVDCIPGSGMCMGNTAHFCRDDGLGYTDEDCDPLLGSSCDPNTGCVGPCSAAALGKSYIGCDYYPTVTANVVDAQFHFAVAVSNTTASAATVTITKGASTVSTTPVAANSVKVITLPWDNTLKGPSSGFGAATNASVKVTGGAYHLRSTAPVTVYQFSPLEYVLNGANSYTNDASLLVPTNAWTGKYRVMARHSWNGYRGFYAVTASQDGTTVTAAAGPQSGVVLAGVSGVPASGNGTFTLNKGDVAEVFSGGGSGASDPDDPTGTLLTANKPIQVIGGHECTNIPDATQYCDHVEESSFPEETIASSFLVASPLIAVNSPKVEVVRIVAMEANTTLTYDPPQAGAPTSIAQAGGWVEIQGNAANFQVTANHPVMIGQYMEGQNAGGNSGDPALMITVGTAQYRDSYLFHAPTNYDTSFCNITAPTGTTVTLDGAAVAAGAFTPIGGSGYSVAKVQISNAGNGNHTVSANVPVGISVYGYGQYTSYWYAGGSNLTLLHQ